MGHYQWSNISNMRIPKKERDISREIIGRYVGKFPKSKEGNGHLNLGSLKDYS